MIRVKILSLLSFPVVLPEDFFELKSQALAEDLIRTVSNFQPDIILCENAEALVAMYPFIRDRLLLLSQDQEAYTMLKSIETKLIERYWTKPQPRVASVFSCTYNTQKYLHAAYGSLVQQTDPYWEWVIVDDGSDSETIAILKEIEQQDCRVRVYLTRHRANLGALKREATNLCDGDYLIELDSDDLLTPDAIQQVRQALDANSEVGMVYSNFAFIDENNRPLTNSLCTTRQVHLYNALIHEVVYQDISQLPLKEWVRNFYRTPHHLRAYRASELRRLGGCNPLLRMEDDTELIYKFFVYSRVMHLDKLLYFYRDTPLNITKATTNLSRWLRDIEIQHFMPGLLHGDTCQRWLMPQPDPALENAPSS